MAKPREGYHEGYTQYEIEMQDDEVFCDECEVDLVTGDTYWRGDGDVMCEACFATWRED